MTHATLHTTNHPRRAHPAVLRAALRSLNRHIKQTDGNTSATYTYDTKQLRQIGESVTYATNGAPFTLASSTTYNALGQKSSHTYPDGASYSYSYDTNNQLSTVGLPIGYGSITLNSYLWSVPTQITLPGGTVRNYSYDGLLRLKELNIKDPGQSQVLNTQYGYDTTSNIVSKASSTSSLQASAATTHYSYDTLDHLTGATYSNSSQTGSTSSPQANESYSYDPLANRITGSNASTGSAQGPSNYSYNANNQLTQAGAVSYSYDTNGNTTSQTDAGNATNTRSYVYDTDNRLIEVHDAANAIIATYRYDPFGRRLSKTLNTTGQGSSTYYFYSAEGLIAEADANGQIIQSYGYAPGSTFTTNPLWTKLSTAGTATYYTYQNDHLGTPQKLLNQSGLTVWSATYDAFGRATVDPASTITNNLRFPGQYADQETGLHYNWMRFYDPNTGRYVTSDPIGLDGGVNMYVYVAGNSMSYVDPLGLMCFDFNKFADQVSANRANNALTLGSLLAAEGVGTMPKTPSEMRALGVPKSEINPVTSQLSRWSGRFGTRALRVIGRTTAGIAAGLIATGAVVFEGFYDWGVIIKAAVDATSSNDCGCN